MKQETLRCIACEKPTIFGYRIGIIEASFCPEHLPQHANKIEIKIRQ